MSTPPSKYRGFQVTIEHLQGLDGDDRRTAQRVHRRHPAQRRALQIHREPPTPWLQVETRIAPSGGPHGGFLQEIANRRNVGAPPAHRLPEARESWVLVAASIFVGEGPSPDSRDDAPRLIIGLQAAEELPSYF